MTTIELNGHPTWVRLPKGRGTIVLLLHGGMSSSASMLRSVGPGLAGRYRIAAFDRRGHGRTADTDEPFHYEDMADQTIAFIEHLGRRVHVVGHSDGGNVALLVVLRRPDLVRRAVVVGANYHHAGLMPLQPMLVGTPGFDEWALKYGAHSPDGVAHAATIVEKTNRLFATEPTLTTDDLARIARPTLVMAGDDDVATLAHTCSMYEAIPEAQLAILPGTSHALLKERPKESVRIIRHFLGAKRPLETSMPVRRAASDV